MVTEGAVAEVLNGVMDPHMNVSLPDMGMVRRITVSEDGDVDVGLVFPCVGCPAWDLIQNDINLIYHYYIKIVKCIHMMLM